MTYARLRFSVVISLWLLAALAGTTFAERYYQEQISASDRAAALERLGIVRYQLESRLASNLSLINGLAAFVSAYPEFTQEQYAQYASQVLAREPALINLAAAPDLVIEFVYPVVGNEAALGLDYRAQTDQWPAVEQVVRSGEMVVAGPLNLVQGGVGVVGRAPVYTIEDDGNPKLWGIVSAPILIDSVFEDAGLLAGVPGVEIAIRGVDSLGAEGEVFFGSGDVFEQAEAIIMPIRVGSGSWQLAGRVQTDTAAAVAGIRGLALALTLLMVFLLFQRQRQQERHASLQRQVSRNERFLRSVERVSQVGGWRLATDGRFTELSELTRRHIGLATDEPVIDLEQFCSAFQSESAAQLRDEFRRAIQYRCRFDVELELVKRDGETIWLHIQGEPLVQGGRIEITGAITDITEAKRSESLIEYQANYDELTGLPNRSLFRDRLQTALLHARRRSTRLAVLFIDLDNFKSVNDNLGHDAGDELLVEAARRIGASVRETDTVGRYSGDEFVAVLSEVFSETAVSRVCADIVQAMAQAFHVNGNLVYCGVSIGVSFYPQDADDADVLIIKADQAMYEVKAVGKNSWQFYTPHMQIESERKHRLYNDLVAALEKNELSVHYQPIVSSVDGAIVGCEALVRWFRPDGSHVSPEDFIAVAEERGLISHIDCLVLSQALQDMGELNRDASEPVALSINVSPRVLQLRDEKSRKWMDLVTGEEVTRCTVEITERVLVSDSSMARPVLDRLHECGVQIAIDDFGTGYSGLGYFSRFPIRTLKIDRSFTANIGVSRTEEALIESMLLLAEKLDLKVVAEGVETEAQFDYLSAAGCQYFQGYLVGRPMAFVDFSRLFRQRNMPSVAENH